MGNGSARAVKDGASRSVGYICHGRACPGHPDEGRTAFLSEMPATSAGMTKDEKYWLFEN